jgi:predicted transcriptional regulator
MVCIQIRLTEEQAKTLKKLASTRCLSVAELIRQAVDSIIQSNAVIDIEERRKRAINAVGKFRSGKRDISKEHDKYLEEAFSE